MTDRYEKIRQALAMGPTPGPWVDGPLYSVVTQDYCAGKKPVIALVELIPTKLDECMANKSLICACDPDTTSALLDERDALQAEVERLRAEVAEWKRVAAAQAELHGEAEERADNLRAQVDALREALADIRSRSSMNFAMHPDPFALTARLGDIYQIADAALAALRQMLFQSTRLREDAERWRVVREMDGGEIYAVLGDCDGMRPELADAAIDAAMQRTSDGGVA